jgi:hypothetical protein
LWQAVQRARLTRRLKGLLSRCEEAQPETEEPRPEVSLFEQPCRWLAIRGEHLPPVQEALHLHHATPCSWAEGLVEAHEDKLFIAPPIAGWILVVGSGLPDPSDDVDHCFHFLAELSRKLGVVQFFDVNRILNYHSWVWFEKGRVQRAYAWAEKTLWNQGAMTAAERELELRCYDYGNDFLYIQREALAANLEKVAQLAARWSIDPGAIPEANWSAANGIVGEISNSGRR